jgi:MoaA/NifB/PqqE/SkfB family radical SAM enzyme
MGRRLRAGVALRPGPSWVQIGITEHCNYRCGMCWAHSHLLPKQNRKHVLRRECFEHLIDQFSKMGTRRLDIGGTGEPLLHPDALEMLQYVKAAGIHCVLITNGSRLTPEMCDAFVDIGLDSVSVSLHAAADETHHRVTAGPVGDRSHIVRMLRYVVESRERRGATKPCASVSFVVQRDNWSEITDIAEEASQLRFNNVEFTALGINEASRELALSREEEREVRRRMDLAQEILDGAGLMTNARHYLSCTRGAEWSSGVFGQTPCYVGHFFCRVLADGSVDPCGASRRVVGNVTRDSFGDIWSSLAYRTFRREAFGLPELGRQLEGCACYTCGHAPRARDYHEKLNSGLFPQIV